MAEYKAKKAGLPPPINQPAKKDEEKEKEPAPVERARPVMDIPPVKKLFVKIKNPEDHASLLTLKQACGEYPGNIDVVLVIGSDKGSAMRLPFKVDGSDLLIGALVKSLGEDCVVLK